MNRELEQFNQTSIKAPTLARLLREERGSFMDYWFLKAMGIGMMLAGVATAIAGAPEFAKEAGNVAPVIITVALEIAGGSGILVADHIFEKNTQ